MDPTLMWLLIAAVVCAVIGAVLAVKKGQNVALWTVMSFMFGPVGIAALLLKPKGTRP